MRMTKALEKSSIAILKTKTATYYATDMEVFIEDKKGVHKLDKNNGMPLTDKWRPLGEA